MAERKPVTSGGGGPNPPSLDQVYPAIARWASGYGWVVRSAICKAIYPATSEIGKQGWKGPAASRQESSTVRRQSQEAPSSV
jgi:hypothetical protein